MSQLFGTRRFLKAVLLTFSVLLTQAGCNDAIDQAKPAASAKPLSKPERIAQAKRILKHIVLPSELRDAYFEERDLGDGAGFGPTDYVSYMYLKVDPTAIDKWTALLETELSYTPTHKIPKGNYPWWVDAERFKVLKFFEPAPLSSRNGWVGISRETGEIWIQDFTT